MLSRHHHGIVLPITCLHSKNSSGNGEILDLLPVLDWMKEVGFDTLQLLPINDTGADSSPYSAISSTALHPILLSLHALPNPIEPLPTFEPEHRFNYGHVREVKSTWVASYVKAHEERLRHEASYIDFLESTPWIHAYGQFVATKEKNQNKPWWEWTLFDATEEEIRPHLLIQYLLHGQMNKVAEEARKRGIMLMGDQPILLTRDSVECHGYRSLFVEGSTVGVPPDFYNKEGQAWGFPPFNWHEIHKENYPFLRERLTSAERYFDLFRLDHILGFFRLWYIPDGKLAKDGHYVPDTLHEGLKQGEYLLRWMIDHTQMQLMGEDLGLVPDEVRDIMRKLDVAGVRVMRWERRYNESGYPFIPIELYDPISMTTISNHDSESLSEWWEMFPDEAKTFAETFSIPYQEKVSQEIRTKVLHLSHHTSSVFHINPLQEYLSLEPAWSFDQPYLERINVPGIVSPFNWTFKTIPPVEEWAHNTSFNQKIRHLIA